MYYKNYCVNLLSTAKQRIVGRISQWKPLSLTNKNNEIMIVYVVKHLDKNDSVGICDRSDVIGVCTTIENAVNCVVARLKAVSSPILNDNEELERLKEDLREYNEALDYVDSFSFEVFGTDNY